MKLIGNRLCRRRYRAQIKIRKTAKKYKLYIFLACIFVILLIALKAS